MSEYKFSNKFLNTHTWEERSVLNISRLKFYSCYLQCKNCNIIIVINNTDINDYVVSLYNKNINFNKFKFSNVACDEIIISMILE